MRVVRGRVLLALVVQAALCAVSPWFPTQFAGRWQALDLVLAALTVLVALLWMSISAVARRATVLVGTASLAVGVGGALVPSDGGARHYLLGAPIALLSTAWSFARVPASAEIVSPAAADLKPATALAPPEPPPAVAPPEPPPAAPPPAAPPPATPQPPPATPEPPTATPEPPPAVGPPEPPPGAPSPAAPPPARSEPPPAVAPPEPPVVRPPATLPTARTVLPGR